MQVPIRECDMCHEPTELMYKVYDKGNQSHDVPICIDCMMALIHRMINQNPKRWSGEKERKCGDQKMGDFLAEDEAIAILLEFADIKIQNIGKQKGTHRDPTVEKPETRAPIALMIRSTYNNQWKARVYPDDVPVHEMVHFITKDLKEIFEHNRYPEDMV